MKGLTLTQLAEELERQQSAKRDFMADTKSVVVTEDDNSSTNLSLSFDNSTEKFPVRRHAVRQIGQRLKIPAAYVDRLAATHPDMLAWNVNQLFQREPEKRMVRVLDNRVRAFLSDRFRPLDNADYAEAVLPKLIQLNANVTSCEITETHMYIKAIIPGIERQVKADGVFFGDGGHNSIHVLKPGICMGNSEVGAGSMFVQPGIHEVHCSNLAIFNRNAMKKYHVGRQQTNDQESMWEIFTDRTKEVSDAAFWLQVQDLVAAALEGSVFESMVAECEAKMHGPTIAKPQEAVKELENISEKEQDGILTHLIRGGDLSQFGMQAAITRFAQDDEVAYERQVELEQLGGKIIELPKTQWEHLAEAA